MTVDQHPMDRDTELPPRRRDMQLDGLPAELADVDDAERELTEPGVWGGPVDAEPDAPVMLYGTITGFGAQERRPIVPAWLRNRHQRAAFAREMVRFVGYVIAFHTWHAPRLIARIAVFAPWGLLRLAGRQLRWWWHPELTSMLQHAAGRNDTKEGREIHRAVRQARKTRGIWLGIELLSLAIAVPVFVWLAPVWAHITAPLLVAPALARFGRPSGAPLVDRVFDGPRFTRLHAGMVRIALCSIGVAGLKEPSSITFPAPGIHRDGPGWLAVVDLPQGLLAGKVVEARGALSSALRLPIDQVWPTGDPAHEGRLNLWVGYLPASKMGQPRWSLLADDARTSVFAEHEFATDQRQRPVKTKLFQRNFLIGGVPGSGKSYGARALVTIAALDPLCELKIAEFKGTGDFLDMEHLCSTYVVGVDDRAFEIGRDIIEWGLAEAERRGERILKLKAKGLAPEGKVTPELAALPGSGLHPVCIVIDEAHELFLYDKAIAVAAERLIKRGRALGIIVILATQIPDAKSVPPNITRCVTVRWCMAVQDHLANDMILGTGAYKRGLSAAVYRPEIDAGWGIFIGGREAGPARSHFPTPDETASIVARATALRGGGRVSSDTPAAKLRRDLVADVREVFARTKAKRLHRQPLLDALVEYWPETYAGWTADMLGEALRKAGVVVVDVKVLGTVGKGVKVEDVTRAIEGREVAAQK